MGKRNLYFFDKQHKKKKKKEKNAPPSKERCTLYFNLHPLHL